MRFVVLVNLLLMSCASAPPEVATEVPPPAPEAKSVVPAEEPESEPEVTYVVEVRTQPKPAIWITVQTPGMASGQTRFLLPRSYGPLGGIPKLVEDFDPRDESGATLEWTVDLEKGMWTVEHAPNASLTVSFRLGENDEPARRTTAHFYRPFADKGLMHVFGMPIFLAPEQVSDRDEHQVRVEWRGFEEIGGNLISSFHVGLEPFEVEASMTGLRRGIFYAGRDLRIVERKVGKNPVYAAISGDFGFADRQFADLLATVVQTQRDFFEDHSMSHMLVSVLPNNERINPETPGQGSSGTAINNGFALFMREGTDFDDPEGAFWTSHLLTHELLHNWIHAGVVSPPYKSGPHAAWFAEGFTTYFTGELLREAGLVDTEGYLKHVNDYVRGYQENPHRELPNEESAPLFWKGKDGHDLPYQRGALVAAHIDRELRKTSSKSLGDLIKKAWRDSREDGPMTPEQFFARVAEHTSPEFAERARAWALDGEPIPLPSHLLGKNFTTATEKGLTVYVEVE